VHAAIKTKGVTLTTGVWGPIQGIWLLTQGTPLVRTDCLLISRASGQCDKKNKGSQLNNGRVEIETRSFCAKTRGSFVLNVCNKESRGMELAMWSSQVI